MRWYLLPEEGEEPPFTRVGEDCWWTEVVGRDGRKRRRDIYLNSLDASRRYEYDAILNVKTPVGKEPKDMAAAALYMACRANNESCTQKDVAEASGTSKVTLRIRLKDLEEVVDKRGGLKKFMEP